MDALGSNAPTQSAVPLKQTKRMGMGRLRRNDYFWAYLMIAPTMIGTAVFSIWPLFQTLYLGFTKWDAFGNYEWTGTENYRRMASDPELWLSLKNTAVFTICTVPVSLVLSTIVAILLNQKIRGIPIYRTLYFLPVVTMPAAVAMVWKWLYNADFGLLNYALGFFTDLRPGWVSDPSIALYSIAVVSVWGGIGYNMIILISGLQGISSTLYEAASIDGASTMTRLFRITLPLLTPTFFFLTITSLIGSLQVFELIFMMIGPNSIAIDATQTIVYYFYQTAFLDNDKGYATAIALLLFAIILLVTVVQFIFQKKWVHYE
ncbi:carbohydrate ABC transporter permease [Paenibacillus artemisiicola]|nr:sugar ABC transporter permease [Paenibacillus artemisiicola]